MIRGLCSSPSSNDPLAECFNDLDTEQENLFSSFMRLISDVEMDEEEARFHYRKIIDHTKKLESLLERKVGFRVGMLDYLLNINPKLQYPKFMELSRYDSILRLTTLDSLTGLYNRRYFDEQLDREIHRAYRYNQTFSVLMIDIDDFKDVNDSHGHPVGDEVLQKFSYIIKNYLRSEDVAARYGGEEFVILLPHTDIHGARIFSERLLERVLGFEFPMGLSISFSGGISNYPYHAEDAEQLLESADKGLYLSKMRGKRCISIQEGERRDTTRYQVETGFAFTPDTMTFYTGRMNDMSITGMAGKTAAELEPGQMITLKLEDREQRVLYDIQAQVVWVNKVEKKQNENVFGARYSDYSPSVVHNLIRQYVSQSLEDPPDPQLGLFSR
jgi:diguanylate cyclase (GGDEF)-like protein